MTFSRLIMTSIIALIVVGIIFSVKNMSQNTVAERPSTVPSTAKWVGGTDGGDWISCDKRNAYQIDCSVYADLSGKLIEQATFSGSVPELELEFDHYDGMNLVTIDGMIFKKQNQ